MEEQAGVGEVHDEVLVGVAGALAEVNGATRATLDFYFTVNGKELRPSGGGTYRGTFDGPPNSYAHCIVP